jgi:hypothetical protein
MSRAEVATTLGGPPTRHSAGPDEKVCFWEGDNCQIQVVFDDDGNLWIASLDSADSRLGLDRALDWLIRQWRRWFPE